MERVSGGSIGKLYVLYSGSNKFHRTDFMCRGCVSGFQLQNLREYLKQGDSDGEYQWDFMDGLDEVPDEYKEKLKTAVIKGKIADEDWKGVCFQLLCLNACSQRLT